jgi:hypothetical protein
LATHEAWRGYPRIHICHERVKGVQDPVIEGVLHHEIGHALFHGSMEFYTFKFTNKLQEMARFNGFDLNHLQQCVYFLSIAIKDWEVIQWLTKIGLGPCQKSLLEYIMNDTEEEREVWGVEQDGLLQLSQWIMKFGGSRFQEKLENAAYGLIEEPFETKDAFH